MPSYANRFLISPQKAAAALLSRITKNTVSSPASVPTTTDIFMASTADAASRGQARHGLDDDDILGIVKAGDTLPKDGVQPGGEGSRPILGRGRITICSKRGQLLDNPEFFDVPGNGGLGTVKPFILKRFQKLLLGLDITGRNVP